MRRLRKIKQLLPEIKKLDPESAVTEHWIMQNIRNGNIRYIKIGNRYLVDLDYLIDEFLQNPPTAEVEEEGEEYGKLRKVR